MENKKVNGGWSKASMVFGIISMILALLPLVSAWFMLLTAVNYLLAPIGIVCGVVAIVKSQNLVKSIIGLLLCVLALCTPMLLAEYYLASTADSVGNMMNTIDQLNNY